MEECRCSGPGYCDFFKQQMTYDPPNWQWCQGASSTERSEYKVACDKKHQRRATFLGTKYIKTSQLIEDCRDLLLPQIAKLKLKGVLGIPRSGILPASMIAMWLNLPLYTINSISGDIQPMSGSSKFGGARMRNHDDSDGGLLVVDDTVYAGRAMADIKAKIKGGAIYAAIYTHPNSLDKVDLFAKELKPPHILEWNLFNCSYIESAMLDFDGILCPNVPHEKCLNEELYIDYIANVEPFPHRVPKTCCYGIVTARLEKYRDITEAWLKKHNIRYGSLTMYPTEKQTVRDKNHIQEAAAFKAKYFKQSSAHFFIESELPEAVIIRRESGKFVICPQE